METGSFRVIQSLLNALDDAAMVIGPGGRLICINGAALDALGLGEEDHAAGLDISRFFLDPSIWREIVESKGKWKGNVVFRFAGRDFSRRLTASPLDSAPGPGGRLVTIKPARETDGSAVEFSDSYYSIFNSVNDAIFIHDMETGDILDVNQSMCDMFKCTRDEATQMKVEDLSEGRPPFNQTRAVELILKAAAGEPQIFEWRCKDREGNAFWGEVNLKMAAIGGRERILAIVRNITERKESELALRDSEERYRRLAENASDVIWTMDLGLNFTYISPSCLALRGYTVKEHMSQTPRDMLTPESFGLVMEAFEREMKLEEEGLREPNRPVTLTMEQYHKDGHTIWAEVTMTMLHGQDGKATGILGVTRDVTERIRAEEERASLEEQLIQSQKMEAIGRLAGGVAHDFNNILTGITGYSEMALAALKPDDPLYADVQEIRKAGERAVGLTNQLLAFSRKQIISPRLIRIDESLEVSRKMLERIIGEDVRLEFKPAESLWAIMADPAQIDQILVNLAVNARDAMPEGGKLVIETMNASIAEEFASGKEAGPGNYVLLAVSDNGQGMDAEVRQRIFEPFFSTKPMGKGTGLGLSTVYGVTKQNGGFIEVDSEPGAGTTFKIYFPAARPEPRKSTIKLAKEIPDGNETILLVEDDRAVRTLARRMLTMRGYGVIEAVDGEDALLKAKGYAGKVDLVLTDVIMPNMNGSELIVRLKESFPGLKSLYMSGYTDDVIGQLGVVEEGVHLLQKPFTIESLSRKVREALDGDKNSPAASGTA